MDGAVSTSAAPLPPQPSLLSSFIPVEASFPDLGRLANGPSASLMPLGEKRDLHGCLNVLDNLTLQSILEILVRQRVATLRSVPLKVWKALILTPD